MGDVTLIGLGFQNNIANRFQSANVNQAPGSAAFYACALVHVRESLLTDPVTCAYFGNFAPGAGWELGRIADTAASDPPNSPEIVTFRLRLGSGGTVVMTYSADASTIFGRTHLLAVSVVGLVATLYLNGTAVAQQTLGVPLVLGASRLNFGNQSGGGARSGDPIVSAAYSDSDSAAFISNQRVLFDKIRNGTSLTSSISELGLTAQYIYEGFSKKAPSLVPPTTPLPNFGSAGTNGDLTFAGPSPLFLNVDLDPDFTGGAQSTSGVGGVSLQDAYDNGNTIVTAPAVPVTVDTITIEDATIGTTAGPINISAAADINIQNETDTGANVFISSGESTVGGAVGNVQVRGGLGGAGAGGGDVVVAGGDGDGPGGDLSLQGGSSNTDVGGPVAIAGGFGGVTAPNGFDGGTITALGGAGGIAVAGGTGGNGGQFIVQGGPGGDATGVGATAGNGAEVNISGGLAGTPAGGAAAGTGGAFVGSGGAGGAGTGGDAQLRSGNGTLASGAVDISVGTSNGLVSPLRLTGGLATGVGSGPGGDIEVTGGNAAVGQGQDGGNVTIDGGTGDGATGVGGAITITGGVSTVGPGGGAFVVGGAGGGGGIDNGGFGGFASIRGGNASQPNEPGGTVQIYGGSASGVGGSGGSIDILGGTAGAAVSTGGPVTIRTGQSGTGLGADAGPMQVSLNGVGGGTPTSVIGGYYVDPANGRFTLRNYIPGAPATTSTGTLGLHVLNTAGEALQVITNGLVHFQSQQAAGTETTVGFRAAKSGDWKMMGRVFQRTFAVGEGVTFAVAHNLDVDAPGVFAYNTATGALIPLVAVVQNTKDQVTITIGGAVNGTVTVIGF